MNWRAIPLALKCAVILSFVEIVGVMSYGLADTYKQAPRVFLAQAALGFVISVMGTVGTLDLARMQTGTARIGAWIAYAGFLGSLVLTFVWTGIECKQSFYEHKTLLDVLSYTYFATTVATLVGLGIATRNVAIGVVCVLVGVACTPPEFIQRHIYEALKDSGHVTQSLVHGAMQLGHNAMVLVLAGFAARGEMDQPSSPRAVWGFRAASKAMWIRVIATCAAPLLMLFAVMGRSEGIAKMIQFATVAAVVVGMWSMLQFSLGALAVARSRVREMGWLAFLFAAAGSLWCAGVSLAQFPKLFQLAYGDHEYGGSYLTEELEAWSVVAPIVAIVAIAFVVAGIAGFASRRLQNDLHTQASSKGVAFVILMFSGVALQQWVMPKAATSEGSLLFMLLCVLAAELSATVMMANLCTLAADSIERDPDLPTATVI